MSSYALTTTSPLATSISIHHHHRARAGSEDGQRSPPPPQPLVRTTPADPHAGRVAEDDSDADARHGSGVRGARAAQPLPQLAHPPHQAPRRAGARPAPAHASSGARDEEDAAGDGAAAAAGASRGGRQEGGGGRGGEEGGQGRRWRPSWEGEGGEEGVDPGARGRHAAGDAAARGPSRLRRRRCHAAARQQAPRPRAQEGIRHNIWPCLALHCWDRLWFLCHSLCWRLLVLLCRQGLHSSLQNRCRAIRPSTMRSMIGLLQSKRKCCVLYVSDIQEP